MIQREVGIASTGIQELSRPHRRHILVEPDCEFAVRRGSAAFASDAPHARGDLPVAPPLAHYNLRRTLMCETLAVFLEMIENFPDMGSNACIA
jgi:hypothetical protein